MQKQTQVEEDACSGLATSGGAYPPACAWRPPGPFYGELSLINSQYLINSLYLSTPLSLSPAYPADYQGT
jgi:hypothetical protein